MSRPKMREPGCYIVVNRAHVWLDAEAAKHGELRLAEGGLSEQCETCARDIIETGNLKRTSGHKQIVVCGRCDEAYTVRKVEGKHAEHNGGPPFDAATATGMYDRD